MALRSDRRTGQAFADAGGASAPPGFTVADVGRLLSRERNRQGLSLQDVAARTGIPVAQLRGAETGALDQPDGLATLKTVRRYADLLGLPGDRFALAILERWPTKGGVPRPLSGPTAAVPALGSVAVTGAPTKATNTNGNGHANGSGGGNTKKGRGAVDGGAPAARTASTDEPTRIVAPVGPVAQPSADADTTSFWGAFTDTGVSPAVVAPAGQVRRRTRRPVPGPLRALIVLVTLAVVVGVALLAIDRARPAWLSSIGLTHASTPATGSSSSATAAHASTGSRAASHPATDPATAELHPRATSAGATFTVPAASFSAKVTAPGGPCWVQVTTNTSSSPAFAGVLEAGSSRTFAHVHSLVVELGSTSGRLSVTSSGGHVAGYAPRGAPSTITVRTRH